MNKNMKILIILFVINLSIGLSVPYAFFGIWPLICLGLLAVVISSISRIIAKVCGKEFMRQIFVRIGLFMVIPFGLWIGAFCRWPNPLPPDGLSVSGSLKYVFITDQADRQTFRIFLDWSRDEMRVNWIIRIIKKEHLGTHDKYYAAWILHHGGSTENYKMACDLASEAYEEHDSAEYKWLRNATYDRWQLSIGGQQKYNTQFDF